MIKKLHFPMSDDKGDYGDGSLPPREVPAAVLRPSATCQLSSGFWGTTVCHLPNHSLKALLPRRELGSSQRKMAEKLRVDPGTLKIAR